MKFFIITETQRDRSSVHIEIRAAIKLTIVPCIAHNAIFVDNIR